MTSKLHIVGLSGSLRQQSYNSALLRYALGQLPDGVTSEIASFAELPIYNPDLGDENPPRAVADFKSILEQGDAYLIATPEYNYGVAGGLKNALDWVSRPMGKGPMQQKTSAIMGASPSARGTVLAQMQLRQILRFASGHVIEKPEVLIAEAPKHFDDQGQLVTESYQKQVKELILALVEYVWALK